MYIKELPPTLSGIPPDSLLFNGSLSTDAAEEERGEVLDYARALQGAIGWLPALAHLGEFTALVQPLAFAQARLIARVQACIEHLGRRSEDLQASVERSLDQLNEAALNTVRCQLGLSLGDEVSDTETNKRYRISSVTFYSGAHGEPTICVGLRLLKKTGDLGAERRHHIAVITPPLNHEPSQSTVAITPSTSDSAQAL